MQRLFFIVLAITLLSSCRPEVHTPKPRGYARVDLPQHAYQTFNEPGFPYSFEYPAYARIVKDTVFFGKKPENPYWINIVFPSLGGQIYLSYKRITAGQTLGKLIEDSHEMSFTVHSKRADYINETPLILDSNVYVLMFDVGGNAASAQQFLATDSVKHFIRGALYFDVTPNADSLRPVNEFLKKDVQHMLETLKWRD